MLQPTNMLLPTNEEYFEALCARGIVSEYPAYFPGDTRSHRVSLAIDVNNRALLYLPGVPTPSSREAGMVQTSVRLTVMGFRANHNNRATHYLLRPHPGADIDIEYYRTAILPQLPLRGSEPCIRQSSSREPRGNSFVRVHAALRAQQLEDERTLWEFQNRFNRVPDSQLADCFDEAWYMYFQNYT
jgi:hypothetical protein